MNDTTTPPVPTARKVAAESTIENSTLTMEFGDGAGTITVTLEQAASAPNASDWLLKGLAGDIRSRYATKRDSAAEAFKAASEALVLLLRDGPGARAASGESEVSALETAMLTIAEVKGLDIERVRAVVAGYADKSNPDGTVLTADAQRKALVAKVKSDPATAAIYAAKRARKSADEPSILDSF